MIPSVVTLLVMVAPSTIPVHLLPAVFENVEEEIHNGNKLTNAGKWSTRTTHDMIDVTTHPSGRTSHDGIIGGNISCQEETKPT